MTDMEPVEVRDIVYVMAVYKERSFSRAAEKNYISQPALSKLVKRVEGKLEIQIFDRSSVPLQVTREGQAVIKYFERIQGIWKEMEQYCDEVHQRRKSDLTVGAPSFFCSYMLPPVISAFRMDYPEISIKLIESNDSDLRKFLRAGIVDLGLSVEPDLSPDLTSIDLQEERIILAVPSSLPINEKLQKYALSYEDIAEGRLSSEVVPAVPLRYFSEEKFIFLRRGNDMDTRGRRMCRDAGFVPDTVMETDQLMSAYYLAQTGAGITFIREAIPYCVGPTD
ncbi:MAG: LysR family transcriptional regulator, partial [Lachnospiraceae bacterium]|nr:LysR family transcriptional regulator [Lachnospiraceae bacterium]